MKFYLSTAITRGRREYVDAVRNICDALKEEGVEVLNDRVADPNFPYPHTDRAETMRELHNWLDEADALIAEATISSTGVGCELTHVQMRDKPFDRHGREVMVRPRLQLPGEPCRGPIPLLRDREITVALKEPRLFQCIGVAVVDAVDVRGP